MYYSFIHFFVVHRIWIGHKTYQLRCVKCEELFWCRGLWREWTFYDLLQIYSQSFYTRFCNGFYEIFQHRFVINIGYYSTSQKLVSRISLACKCLLTNRDVFYEKMVLIFFINIIAKPHVKTLTVTFVKEQCWIRLNSNLTLYIGKYDTYLIKICTTRIFIIQLFQSK